MPRSIRADVLRFSLHSVCIPFVTCPEYFIEMTCDEMAWQGSLPEVSRISSECDNNEIRLNRPSRSLVPPRLKGSTTSRARSTLSDPKTALCKHARQAMGSTLLCRSCLGQSFQLPVRRSRNGFGSARLGCQLLQSAQLREFAFTERSGGQKDWNRSYASKPGSPTLTARPSNLPVRRSRPETTKPHKHNKIVSHDDLHTTRPAPLHLPDFPETDSQGNVALQIRFKYLYNLGKGYLTFYKTGFKNIWANYKLYRKLDNKILGLPTSDMCALVSQDQDTPRISRQEYQLYLRTKHDIRKLIPMGLILAVCGEFSPLVVLAIGNVVTPYTCRIPKQIRKQLTKLIARKKIVDRSAITTPQDEYRTNAYILGADPFGLCNRRIPILSSLLWSSWVSRRMDQSLGTLFADALLIRREGGARSLSRDELLRFCIEAGAADMMQIILDSEDPGALSPVLGSKISDHDLDRIRKWVDAFIERAWAIFSARPQGHTAWPPRLSGRNE